MSTPLFRPSRLAAALLIMTVAFALPAKADGPPPTTSVWGSSGLILMPTAAVHGFRDFSVGTNVLTKQLAPGIVPYVTAGLFEGLEATVLYGVPLNGFSGLSGSAKYQLIRPTRERPTAVAIGLSLLGVNGTERFVEGNDLYMVISQDLNTVLNGAPYTLVTAHFGFEGNLSGSRMMAGLELPLGDKASLTGEFMGPVGVLGGFFNVGAVYRPLREWQVRAYTMGSPGAALTDRDYAIGISYWGNILGKPKGDGDAIGAPPSPSATPHRFIGTQPSPGAVSPHVSPAPLPVASKSPAPSASLLEIQSPVPDTKATVRGTLLDDKGRPLAGWGVGVAAVDRWTTTDIKGRYALELPLGPYDLMVQNPQGNVASTKAIRLVTAAGMELPLVVTLPVGELKGLVIDKNTKQGLGDATVQLFRAGESFSFAGHENGAFHAGDLPAGEYRVVVTRSRYQAFESTFSLVAKQEKSLIVALLPKPGSLAGRVSNLKGQGQVGITVAIPKLKLSAATDKTGAYVFLDLPPGQHEVIVTQGAKRISTTLVRVRSDETTTENVTLTPVAQPQSNKAGTIGGVVIDAASRRPLSSVKIVVEGGELTVLTITGADGHYAVGDLPPGRYKVTASRSGYAAKPLAAAVTAKAGATLNVALVPVR